jgi:hypothetical protein
MVQPQAWALSVASLVWGMGLSLGGTTGYAINPARDLGSRLAHAILPIAGKGAFRLGLRPNSCDRPADRGRPLRLLNPRREVLSDSDGA